MRRYTWAGFVMDLFYITQTIFWVDTLIECVKAAVKG